MKADYSRYINEYLKNDSEQAFNTLVEATREMTRFYARSICHDDHLAEEAYEFAQGKANIFFIRKKERPDRSHITVELDDKCENIRQLYSSYNQVVRNKRDLEFVHDWLEHNRRVNR